MPRGSKYKKRKRMSYASKCTEDESVILFNVESAATHARL